MLLRDFRTPSSKRRWLIGGFAVLAAAVGVLWLIAAGFDWMAVPRAMNRLDTGTVLVLTTILPLAGFPISMVYLLVGARFGPAIGLLMVSGITALHLLGTHWIARSFLRRPLQRFVERRNHHVPEVPPGENFAVALMVMLAPAIPYFVRNYVLALSGIPLRVYLWVALPIHVLRSYVALFLGDFGSQPSQRALVFLGIFYGTKLAIFACVLWWLRRRHKRIAAQRA
jgi:uncharacterized membrane protein YdjX (TVP38/TMEM64 family)